MKNQGRGAHVTCLHIDCKTYSVHKNDLSVRNSRGVINNHFCYFEFIFFFFSFCILFPPFSFFHAPSVLYYHSTEIFHNKYRYLTSVVFTFLFQLSRYLYSNNGIERERFIYELDSIFFACLNFIVLGLSSSTTLLESVHT